jgi:hypothetical protein
MGGKDLAFSRKAASLARLAALWQGTRRLRDMQDPDFGRSQRCRSSVVEHSLGKGEVVSSILPGSTIAFRAMDLLSAERGQGGRKQSCHPAIHKGSENAVSAFRFLMAPSASEQDDQ